MKVNVLTVEDVKIPKWRWWTSQCLPTHVGGYLLQMKISRRNAKKFKVVSYQPLTLVDISAREAGDLTQMSETSPGDE